MSSSSSSSEDSIDYDDVSFYTRTLLDKETCFSHTWKIEGFKDLLEQSLKSEDRRWKGSDEAELWKISMDTQQSSFMFLGVQLKFDNEAAKIPRFINYLLQIYLIDNEGNKKLLIIGASNPQVTYDSPCFIKKEYLLSEAETMLPNGNLTLVFEITFTYKVMMTFDEDDVIRPIGEQVIVQELTALATHMWNNKLCVNAKVIAHAEVFDVNKSMLEARSPVLKEMFAQSAKENNENIIEMKDFDDTMVYLILKFIYTTQLKGLEIDDAKVLLEASDKYKIDNLKTYCEDLLVKNLKPDNVTTYLILADKYNALNLKNSAMYYFKRHVRKVVETESFETDFKNLLNFLPTIFKAFVTGDNFAHYRHLTEQR